MQKRALKIISGQGSKYAESIEKLGIDTLETRRLALVDNFLDKAIVNTRFSQRWFPVKEKTHITLGMNKNTKNSDAIRKGAGEIHLTFIGHD